MIEKQAVPNFGAACFMEHCPLFFITIFTENGTIEVLISENQMSKRRQVV
ncbi:hypothetical protein NI447_06790 [Enterococcus lactis]|nr:hypothetical protein [Enterococcus lactis]